MVGVETEKIRKYKEASVPRENKNEENKKIKMGQHAKGDHKSRSAGDMSVRFGSGRIRSFLVKG